MNGSFKIKKVVNNNVLLAEHSSYQEVVLIGKGAGFGRKKGDFIDASAVEKLYVLKNEKEQEQYMKLIDSVQEEFIGTMNDIIHMIEQRVKATLDEHIHIALTDHISFAISRIKRGMDFHNPFLVETKALYPLEYGAAKEVVNMLEEKLGISIPEGEAGFIALHIHSAITKKNLSEVNAHSQLISSIIQVIEDQLDLSLDREEVHYMRLVSHLRHAIDRVLSGEVAEEPKKLAAVLKEEYPLCYNLSWKVIKIMQQALNRKVYDAEAVYLTMHLQRLVNKTNEY